MDTETCSICGQEQPTENFYRNRRSCKSCLRDSQRRYRAERPDYHHGRNLRQRYGICPDEYQTLLANQNNTCPICEVEISETLEYKGSRSAVVDHNHDTGDVRGILCSMCNKMLGHARESTDILYKAIVYLSERGAYTPKK